MGVALNSCLEFEFSHKAEPLPLKIDRSLFLKQSPFFPIAIAGIASALPGRAARGRGHKFLGASTASGRRCWNSVRRQSFWDRRWIKIESLWLLWFVILCGLPTVQQAAIGDCPFDQNGLAAPEVDVGGRQVGDALVISQVIVVGDEGRDLGFEIARQVIVFEQDAVLERLMSALDLSLGHRVIRRATGMLHVLAVEPLG